MWRPPARSGRCRAARPDVGADVDARRVLRERERHQRPQRRMSRRSRRPSRERRRVDVAQPVLDPRAPRGQDQAVAGAGSLRPRACRARCRGMLPRARLRQRRERRLTQRPDEALGERRGSCGGDEHAAVADHRGQRPDARRDDRPAADRGLPEHRAPHRRPVGQRDDVAAREQPGHVLVGDVAVDSCT